MNTLGKIIGINLGILVLWSTIAEIVLSPNTSNSIGFSIGSGLILGGLVLSGLNIIIGTMIAIILSIRKRSNLTLVQDFFLSALLLLTIGSSFCFGALINAL
ncbi:MAG: hypothetical protein KDD67_03540 [Ignavibacteriae bacterium]|nr:hypothetical protein [Ignavibacteriota bacterium]MCB9215086.1 hypothetical protein [Ignavibacteria bacterium]